MLRAVQGKLVVSMYHEQGHIPMKLLDFDGGDNIRLGLPIISTSVDPGTAHDITHQGIARATSLIASFDFARRLAEGGG